MIVGVVSHVPPKLVAKSSDLTGERELTVEYRSWLRDKHRINVVVKLKIGNFH